MANVTPGATAPPAPVITPAAPATPGMAPGAPPALQKRTVAKSYQTTSNGLPVSPRAQVQRSHAERAAAAQAAADKAAPAPAAPAKNDGAAAKAGQAPALSAPAREAGAATEAPSTTPTAPPADAAATPPPEAPKPEKLAEGEFARRMATLVREDARITQAKQQLAQERAQHAEGLRRVQLIEEARTKGAANKLQFIAQAFGWTPQQMLDEIVNDGARTPEQRQTETAQQFQQRMAAIEREIQEGRQAEQRRQEGQQVQSYIASAIDPAIAGNPEFAIISRALGARAGQEVYSVLAARFKSTQRIPELQGVLREVAAHLKSEAERHASLLGGVSAPVVPPASKPNGPPATRGSAPPMSGLAKRQRNAAPAYKSRPL